ncbi:PTS mannose/fructose/sorbose transporter subunit IIAB [Lactobacillus gigeriorum]|uniref:PTS system mannose-specific EIIAB component n=1 Tax=Lactobacillus gigeriorum DSM 23908 = CRBIP 24.85 TaxID=1423751 RepID=I7LG98_9LACO|nr:PTS mannose/fructose/sorbose transporter subunit IIAB [Lactobacillus gigeriorum]KRN11035.1 phosphoenolpyruvate-dependent sugar phosphotransferase system, IIAB component [Lactobacillus gigeriorum DSM 23908 = CRBIP 24.85]CCI87413.1 PTS system sorbose-specific IIAB components [Lactobacillus gigeriorum DSM 23908 = CRBIP 24.85]
MSNFLVVSHGNYAIATLASCEMIAGKLSNVKAIAFRQTMNQEDLLKKIAETAATFDELPTIIVDLVGGTPANTALRFKGEHPEVKIYSGLSLPLLLAAVMGTPMNEAIAQANDNAQELGVEAPKPSLNKEETRSGNEQLTPHQLSHVRIDERLIHGQVATLWTNALKLQRIMVVDDEIVKSPIQKTALKTACPNGVHLSILTTKGAARRINSGKYEGQTVLLLVKNPGVLRKLVDLAVLLPEINVGNMSTKAGTKQVAKSVAVSAQDIADFKYLAEKGSHLYHQMVPAEAKSEFLELLK